MKNSNKQNSNVTSIFGIKRMLFIMENIPSFYEKLCKHGKLNQYISNFEKRATAMYDELIQNGKITMDDPSFGIPPYEKTMRELRHYAMQDVMHELVESYEIAECDMEEVAI